MDTSPVPARETPSAGPHSPQDPTVGSAVGKYRIMGRLGQGGMGVVYEAEDTVLERRVALKVLPAGSAVDPEARDRFQREARAAARLTHPNVVTVYDVGHDGGVDFIAMELVRGMSVQALLDERKGLTWEEATRIVRDVCRGLAAAHDAGLIHRDIKPSNVMLADDGTAKLADFGLVRATGASVTSLTGVGVILGTPCYMSPEQCRAEGSDERSDVYALGATYYELLCGRTAFPAEQAVQIMFAHCSSPVPDPRVIDPRIPERCVSIVKRAMAKRPADRYPTARAMLTDLQAALGGTAATAVVMGEAATRIASTGRSAGPIRRLAPVAAILAISLLVGLAIRPWAGAPADAGAPSSPGSVPPSPKARPRPTWSEIRLKGVNLDMGGHAKAVAFSRVGGLFAAGACDGGGGVVVWDLATGEERLRRWEGVKVHAVAFSPDGSMLAAAGEGEIRLWDFGWKAERTLPGAEGEAIVSAVVFSQDGRCLIAGLQPSNAASDPRLRVSDVAHGTTRSVPETCVQVDALAVSPDGKTLASGAGDGTLTLWSLPDVAERRDLATGLGSIWSLSFAAEGRLLAVGGDASVQIWDAREGTRQGAMLGGPGEEVFCVAFSPARGSHLASGGGRILLWDAVKRTESNEVGDERADAVFGIAISPDGSILATACWDGVVRLRDVTSLWK